MNDLNKKQRFVRYIANLCGLEVIPSIQLLIWEESACNCEDQALRECKKQNRYKEGYWAGRASAFTDCSFDAARWR